MQRVGRQGADREEGGGVGGAAPDQGRGEQRACADAAAELRLGRRLGARWRPCLMLRRPEAPQGRALVVMSVCWHDRHGHSKLHAVPCMHACMPEHARVGAARKAHEGRQVLPSYNRTSSLVCLPVCSHPERYP